MLLYCDNFLIYFHIFQDTYSFILTQHIHGQEIRVY